MLDVVRFAVTHVPARHILVYLPGWEGRYYGSTANSDPIPVSVASFARPARECARGAHVMPLFGGNCVNAWLPCFAGLGPAA